MWRPLILVAMVLAAGACGGDGSSVPETSPTSSTSPPTIAATTTPPTTAPAPTTTSTSTTTPTTTTLPPAPTSVTSQPASTTTSTTTPVPLESLELRLEVVATGFEQPVFVDAPAGDPRLFVVDQPGRVFVISEGEQSVLLDIRDRVRFGGEQGLLGLAFHPTDSDRVFLHYTALNGSSTLSEFDAAGTERVILNVGQPAANHNGGMIAFGPDHLLYVGLGDGGAANDRFANGQDTDTMLGSILRIDVDGVAPYQTPPDNPFAEGGGAPEIWAWGLRNPWRFSFDGSVLFIADVGQNEWEEINVVDHRSRGVNFGWPLREATHCFSSANACEAPGLIDPVVEYDHGDSRCSVTGGYVYRGGDIPALGGAYFYGDYCSGSIWSFRIDGEGIFDERDWTESLGSLPLLTSFGTDGFGELYLTEAGGTVWKVTSS